MSSAATDAMYKTPVVPGTFILKTEIVMSLEEKIAMQIQQHLLDQIRSVISCEDAVQEFFCQHHRLCLSNDDKSAETNWYRVESREQVLAIEHYFCPQAPLSERESIQVLDVVILGFRIDFAKPTFLSYDLNRLVPLRGLTVLQRA